MLPETGRLIRFAPLCRIEREREERGGRREGPVCSVRLYGGRLWLPFCLGAKEGPCAGRENIRAVGSRWDPSPAVGSLDGVG